MTLSSWRAKSTVRPFPFSSIVSTSSGFHASPIIRKVSYSHIVLHFNGWVHQTRTDFLEGRSVSIEAASSALESAGFALPEPICLLRFDEAASPPVQRTVQSGNLPKRKEARPPSSSAAGSDTAPHVHVAKLFDEERAAKGSRATSSTPPGRSNERRSRTRRRSCTVSRRPNTAASCGPGGCFLQRLAIRTVGQHQMKQVHA